MRTYAHSLTRTLTGAVALMPALAAAPSPTTAQLANASVAAFSTANNFTARARGFSAVALNPAGLGMADNPGFSLALLPVVVEQGLSPIGLSDFSDWEGEVIPAATREAWLDEIAADGGERGSGGVGISAMALNVGRIGFQLSTIAFLETTLNEDAAELMLFGNAGRTGQPRDFVMTGSALNGYVITTGAVSLGLPLEALALGATVKYSVGHAVLVGRDAGSRISSDPIELDVEFPLLSNSTEDEELNNGTGIGLDLGAALTRGPWTLGVSVQNVVNTFEWDVDQLVYRPGTALFDGEVSESDFDERPASGAPASLLSALEAMTFEPSLSAGAALDLTSLLTLSADFRQRFGDEGIRVGPDTHLGAGLEFRPVGLLSLRGGAALVSGGIDDASGLEAGGGLELNLGPVHLGGGVLLRTGDFEGMLGSVALSFGGR